MMRRSFAEIDSAKAQSRRIKELSDLKKKFASFCGLSDCTKCIPSINEYYHKCSRISELSEKIKVRNVSLTFGCNIVSLQSKITMSASHYQGVQ